MKELVLPHYFNNTYEDIDIALELLESIMNCDEKEILVDFTTVRWFSGELTSLLGIMIGKLQSNKKTVLVKTNENKVSNLLRKNGFFEMYKLEDVRIDTYQSTIPFLRVYSESVKKIEEYLNDSVFPKITSRLPLDDLTTIQEAVFELMQNVKDHAESDILYVSGQYYPNKHKIELSFADAGVTIPKKFLQKYESSKSDDLLIKWATEEGNSTKNISSSGLGLYDIKESLNGIGKLTIVSNYGYYSYEGEDEEYLNRLESPLPGTLVNLTFYMYNHDKRSQQISFDEIFDMEF